MSKFVRAIVDGIESGDIDSVDTHLVFNTGESINPVDKMLEKKFGDISKLSDEDKLEKISAALKDNKKLVTYQLYDACCKSYFNTKEVNDYLKLVASANEPNVQELFASLEEDCLAQSENFAQIRKYVRENSSNSRENKVNSMLFTSLNQKLLTLYDDGEEAVNELMDNLNVRKLTDILNPKEGSVYDAEMCRIFREYLQSLSDKNKRPSDYLRDIQEEKKKGKDPAYILTVKYFENMVPKVMDVHFYNMLDAIPQAYKKLVTMPTVKA